MKKIWCAVLLLLTLNGAVSAENLLEYQVEDIDGELIDLARLESQWVVVNFWATWCKPCRKEIPDLSALHDERDDVTVIGLAFEEIEVAQIKAFLVDYPATYPIAVVDVYEPPEQFGTPRVLPTTIVIAPDGRMAKRLVGPITREMLEHEISLAGDADAHAG